MLVNRTKNEVRSHGSDHVGIVLLILNTRKHAPRSHRPRPAAVRSRQGLRGCCSAGAVAVVGCVAAAVVVVVVGEGGGVRLVVAAGVGPAAAGAVMEVVVAPVQPTGRF